MKGGERGGVQKLFSRNLPTVLQVFVTENSNFNIMSFDLEKGIKEMMEMMNYRGANVCDLAKNNPDNFYQMLKGNKSAAVSTFSNYRGCLYN